MATDDHKAIGLANASPFGLSLSLWTGDLDRGLAVAKRITTGAVFINATAASDARVPFGGTKKPATVASSPPPASGSSPTSVATGRFRRHDPTTAVRALLLENIHPVGVRALAELGWAVTTRAGAMTEPELIAALRWRESAGDPVEQSR